MQNADNTPGTEYRTGRGERFSYWMYFFGENIFYGLIAINMQAFYSDMGITAASIAAILFVTKIWDAINDPLFGVLIDRIKFKHGRFLPWLRLALPLLAISSILFFALPGHANPALKIVWACAAYIAWDASYTLCDVPIFILPTSMTDNIKERNQLLAMGRYFAMIGITGTAMLLPILQKRLGWLACGIIFSILAVITMLPLCFKAKERRVVRPEKEISLKQMAHYVISNKYLLFYCVMFVSGLTNFIQYVTLFFARHNLGNQDAAALLSLMSMIPTLLIGALIPVITRHLDKFNLYIFCQVAASILGIVRYFADYENLRLFYVLFFLHSIFTSANNILLFMFTPDCLEYGTYHTGERAEGVAASVQTFFSKLVGSLSGPLAMLILAACGFVPGGAAVQPPSALHGIWLCFTLIPSVGIVLALTLLSLYKLRDKDVQIMAQYNSGSITKEDADEKLAAKYGPAALLSKMTVTEVS